MQTRLVNKERAGRQRKLALRTADILPESNAECYGFISLCC